MVHTHAFSDFKLKETGILPPYSNTGVQTLEFTLRPDYLSGTIPMLHGGKTGERLVLWLMREFSKNLFDSTSLRRRGGRNGFKRGMTLYDRFEKELGSIFWGGQRGRVFFELKGGLCKLLTPYQWASIHGLLKRYNGRINRFDLAGDDWFGKYFIQPKIRLAHQRDASIINPSSAKNNYALPVGIHDTQKGYTLEFGTDTSTYYHVIYQKFRESAGTYLANKFPAWMRWEVRIYRQKGGEVDLDIIHPDNWGPAYLGSCAYLEQLFGKAGRKFTYRPGHIKESVIDRFVAAYTAFEAQWGGFVAECHRLGLEVPSASYAVVSGGAYSELSPSDLPYLKEAIDCARRGEQRSAAVRAQSLCDFPDW